MLNYNLATSPSFTPFQESGRGHGERGKGCGADGEHERIKEKDYLNNGN